MTVIVNDIKYLTQSYISDDTTERISDTEMYNAITEACVELIENNKNAMSNMTFPLSFINGKHYYKIPPNLYSVFGATDLRVEITDETGAKSFVPFNRTSSDKIVEDITLQRYNDTYALDRYDGDMYLALCYQNGNSGLSLIDTTVNSGIIAQLDGSSVNVNVPNTISGKDSSVQMGVTPDVNNSARIWIDTEYNLGAIQDLSRFVDTGIAHVALSFDDPTDITSITLGLHDNGFGGGFFVTVDSQEDSIPFSDNNNLLFDFETVLNKSSLDFTNVVGISITVNYSSGKIPFNVYVDSIEAHVPTKFNFHYLSYSVGRDIDGNNISQFTNELDVPYFSGQYDNFKFVVARYAASILLFSQRLHEDAQIQRQLGELKMRSINNIIPSDHRPENKSFRPAGINFRSPRRL